MWELDHEKGWVLKNWCFQIVVLEETLESPLNSKGIKPVCPKEIKPEYSLEGLMLKLKLQYVGHLIWRANSLEKILMLGKTEGRRTTDDEMVGWHHWLDGHEFEQTPGVGDGKGSLVCCSPWSRRELDTTEWLNNKNSKSSLVVLSGSFGYHWSCLISFLSELIPSHSEKYHFLRTIQKKKETSLGVLSHQPAHSFKKLFIF